MRELLYTCFRIPGASGEHVHGFHVRQQLLIEAFAPLFDRVTGVYWMQMEAAAADEVVRDSMVRTAAAFGMDARVFLLPLGKPRREVTAFDFYARALWQGPRDLESWSTCTSRQLSQLASIIDTVRPSAIFAEEITSMLPLAHLPRHRVPVFFDVNDILSVKLRRDLAITRFSPGLPLRWLQLPALKRQERRALRAATLSFVCSENDRELAQKRFGGRAAVIPNAVELPRSCGTPSAQEALLFVGSLGYGPNRDAADWMIEHIWPLIRERKPNARFLIAGANPEALSGRGAEGVECLGFVPDLAPVYAQARLVVCPLRSGSGTRVKLLEAAAHARAIVSTSIGAEGISFVDGRDALIRDEPAAFASACVDLLEDAERATGLGLAARAFVQDGYSRSAVIERATRLVAAEMERHAPSAESPACAERGRRA